MGYGDWVLQVVAWQKGYSKGFAAGAAYAVLIIISAFMVIVGSFMVLRG